MTGIAEKKYQSTLISYIGSFLIFSLLVAGCITSSLMFFSKVSYAFSTATQYGKPPLSFSNSASAATPPTPTTSRYITHKDTPGLLYTDGCNQATAFVGGVVILDFGDTVFQNGTYGTFLPGTSTGFVSNNSIKALVKQYLSGYAACDTNTTGANLVLGIGTDNGGPYMTSTANASSAGKEWANIVVNVRSWIVSQKLAQKERAFGATQIKLENNTVAITRAWVDGFGTVSSNTGVNFINYGDATGCPTVDSATDSQCSNGWMQSNIAYVSWDAIAAYPLPQIYDTAGNDALQWQSIEYYQRINNLGGPLGPMFVQGSLTQYHACLQVGGCQGTNNTPGQGWQQIYNALESNSVTTQPKVWDSTDFQWDKQEGDERYFLPTVENGGLSGIVCGTSCQGTNNEGCLQSLDPATGSFIQQDCFPSGNVLGAVTAVPGVAVVGAGPDMEVVSAASGQSLFSYADTSSGAIFYGAASIANGVLYIGDTNGNLYAFAP